MGKLAFMRGVSSFQRKSRRDGTKHKVIRYKALRAVLQKRMPEGKTERKNWKRISELLERKLGLTRRIE